MDDAARRVHDRGMNKPVIPPAETTSHTMASYRATGWEGDSGARRFMPALVIVVLVAVGGVAIEFALSDQPKLNEAAAREPAGAAALDSTAVNASATTRAAVMSGCFGYFIVRSPRLNDMKRASDRKRPLVSAPYGLCHKKRVSGYRFPIRRDRSGPGCC